MPNSCSMSMSTLTGLPSVRLEPVTIMTGPIAPPNVRTALTAVSTAAMALLAATPAETTAPPATVLSPAPEAGSILAAVLRPGRQIHARRS